MLCHACLTKNDTVPSLICCPTCQGWCCREDVDWCAGLIVQPVLGTEELAELSRECEWDSETIVRSHQPKPSPCKFCTHHELAQGWAVCRNSVYEMEPDHCPSKTPFMSQLYLCAAHCSECVDQSPGNRCACGLDWLCDLCSAIGNKSVIYPYLITCPRCGVQYCTGPHSLCEDYIEICRGCRGVILCKDCQEEEEITGDTQTETEPSKQVVFTARCSFCDAWSCPDCHASARTATCYLCRAWICYNCISDQEYDVIKWCYFCKGNVCSDCRILHQACPGTKPASVFRISQMKPDG